MAHRAVPDLHFFIALNQAPAYTVKPQIWV